MVFFLTWAFWKWALIVNALLGTIAFAVVWNATEIHRKDNWKLEKVAISTCRRDVKRWNKFKLYLGAITFALPRFILMWVGFALCFCLLK